ncbi:DUF6174 domain-containing protein [Nocardioides bruguierae]|uniref:DUF6174 domain-containing protein n=1 Tax=Nocardioides bruguierae TaxID=2945102 RepID=UPI00201FB9CB|nr:DUF6174 domain-containing protein [Nocardioides bruguierae]MCL8024944.1 DUF6174 domain-containing protein [Nocardioides bruguierae]
MRTAPRPRALTRTARATAGPAPGRARGLVLGPVLALLLTACSGSGTTTAADPAAQDDTGGSTGTASSTPDPGTDPSTSPTAEPTVGTYPGFGPTSYSYTLVVGCFCPDGGSPVRVTVVDDEVVSAVYLRGGGRGGVEKGQEAPAYRWVSLDDVIDAANDTEADQVVVDWPDGQDFPSAVAVDTDERMADEEISYQVRDVEVTG